RGSQVFQGAGDFQDEALCEEVVHTTVEHFETIDIHVNNAAVHFAQASLSDITSEQWETTFRIRALAALYLTHAARPYIPVGGTIINSSCRAAFRGGDRLIDYSATKGALVSFTRALASSLVDRGIRVNAVAPGRIWTPLIPASFNEEEVAKFGQDVPMGRAGQPVEVATSYLFLASSDASYFTGQTLHPNGGVVVNT